MTNKNQALTGVCNKRLNNEDLRNNQSTFPLADVKSKKHEGNVGVPAKEDVEHAKQWVDNGSLL